jgi:tetratricopeptide (TPR) repeat protein
MEHIFNYRRILQIFLLDLVYSLCVAQNSSQISEMQKNIEIAREIIPQKRYEEAIALLSKVIKNYPDNYQAYLLRSQAKYALKDYLGSMNDAQDVLAESFKADSNSIFTAYWNIGSCYNSMGLYEKAIESLKRAELLSTCDVELHFSLAYSYVQLQHLDSAEIELDALLTLAPLDQRGYYGKGRVNLLREKYREAIIEFDKAININSNYLMAYQNRGEAKRQLGDNVGSCSDWRKCIELGMESMKPYLDMVCK